jgi:CHASE3 domain sensor protein/GAF domain-containing protein
MTIESSPQEKSSVFGKISGLRFFRDQNIGRKLTLGFGILVVLVFLGAGISYLGSNQATTKINLTDEVRVPVALAAARAQADLLKMQADVRGYLALGDPVYRERYYQSQQAFEQDLATLQTLASGLDEINKTRLQDIQTAYDQWSELPDQLFELRDDKLEREPAYRLLATEGTRHAGTVLIGISQLIELQGQREPTAENLALLQDMAKFQGNFAAMLSALRGYVTTRNRIFRGEYEVNLVDNNNSWERLSDNYNQLTPSQQAIFDTIAQERASFLALPDQMFADLEGERWREDLYKFSTEAVPLTDQMQQKLNDLVSDQQNFLARDLRDGRADLFTANYLILASGFVALVVGLLLAFIFRATIAGPVRRLTGVAEQIKEGDLEAQAQVEANDEIGTLAGTFNSMTGRLRETLEDVRHEKQRADDLLEVVIPIGVELASEKDFNRLLEKMLLEAKQFCHADTGILMLKTEDNRLEFVIVRNDSLEMAMGGTSGNEVTFSNLQAPLPLYDPDGTPNEGTIATRVALTGQSLNISDTEQMESLGLSDNTMFGKGYRAISHLVVPLKNSEDEVIGVMQLINSQDPQSGEIVPFDENLQQMMESFSMLAVAALEAYVREQQLRQEIKQLRVEIDHAKREREVRQIVDDDSFKTIQARARELRRRRREKSDDES